jgi:NADH-quinone oxidoreductase subunit A
VSRHFKGEISMLVQQYGLIGIFAVIAFIFPIATLGLTWLLRPKRPNPIKNSTYECGIETVGDAWVQFRAQYYLFALIFVVFDIEAIFLFPFAVAFHKIGLFALVEAILFIFILVVGLLYAWKKDALEWQ